MLGDKAAMATIAVRDAEAARAFYEGALGLAVESFDGESGVGVYRAGSSRLVIYRSDFAGTNKATAATWGVGDALETIVEGLEARGVRFLTYDIPGMARRGMVQAFGDFRAAWFEDADGNILHVNSD